MRVDLKCFAKLSKAGTCDFSDSTTYEMNPGETARDLVKRAHVSAEDVKLVFVNNKIVDLETLLSDGDKVALAPAVGGM